MTTAAGATVLIVEDDPGIAELEKTRLEEAGYRTRTAATAEDAIRALGGNDIDLILLDYRLPGGVDGLDFYARVKAAGYDVPVILVTGYSSEATVIQALRVGVRDFVTKSVEYLDYLPDAVGRVLQQVRTEHQLAGIIASAKDAIISTGPDRRVVLFNPAAERMFRCPAAEALRRRVTDFIPDELAASGGDAPGPGAPSLSHRLRTGTRGVRADGEEFPVEVSVARGEASGRRFYTLVVRDVTDRNRAEEALRASNDLLRAVTEGTTDLIFVKDRAGRYLMLNSAAAAFLGRPAGDLVGRDAAQLLPPDTAGPVRLHDAEVMAAGETRTYEESATRAGQTRVFLTTRSPYRDAAGAVTGVVGISRDITDRMRAKEELRAWKARYEAAVRTSGQVLYDWDAGGDRLTWGGSCREIFGYSPDEMPGNLADFLVLIHPDDRPAFDLEFQRATATGEPFRLVYRVRHRGGGDRVVDAHGQFVPIPGEAARMIGFVADVTERKRLEEQFRQAQKMEAVGRLAGGVAHDFNNLLTVINGYSQVVLDGLSPGDPNREMVEEVYKAGERAAMLTRQLLVFSRKDVTEPRVLDLNAVVEGTGRMLRRLIGEDVRLSVVPAPDLAPVTADPGQVEQVIMNLAVNARDAMPTGGRLTIETANVTLGEEYARAHAGVRPGRYVLLAVSDTGCGMTDGVKARIFEPFFTTKEAGKGTGLGLATVYGIVTQWGGHVEVYTEVGRGTTFKAYLPPAAGPGGPGKSIPGSRVAPRGTETVLLVEDDPAVRALARLALQASGYDVLEAETGEEAVRVCDGHPGPVHLLLTDVVMTGAGGRQVAERVAARRPGVKVLFMSGYTDDAVVRHGVLSAGVAFLQKPFTPAALARKVREVLDQTA